jgi:hypothetical protein
MQANLTIGCVCALFVLLALPFLGHPVDGWEWLNLCAAQQIVARGVPSHEYPVAGSLPALADRSTAASLLLIHPPSSAYLSAVSLRMFGDGAPQARLPGIATVVLTALLLPVIARHLSGAAASGAGVMAVGLYLIHPATLQGALYLGFSDGTLLPLSWILFLVAWFNTFHQGLCVRATILGLAFAIALWAKIPTSLALPFALGLVVWQVQGMRAAIAVGGGMTAVGLGLFLVTWWGYVAYLSGVTGIRAGVLFAEPFRYLVAESRGWVDGAGLLLVVIRVFVFLGPLLLTAAAIACARQGAKWLRAGRMGHPEDLIVVLVGAVMLAYVALPGGTGGFMKYHLVILPLLALLASQELSRAWPNGLLFAGAVAGGVVYHVYLVGDLLKLLNHDLRMAFLGGGASHVMGRMALASLFYGILPLGVLAVVRSWRQALLITIVAAQVALVFLQIGGHYITKHSYGTAVADFRRVVDLVKSGTAPQAEILALPEFGYVTGRRIIRGVDQAAWSDPGRLAEKIREARPSAVVYGLPTLTVSEMRGVVESATLRATLEGDYRRVDVGDFTVWSRL